MAGPGTWARTTTSVISDHGPAAAGAAWVLAAVWAAAGMAASSRRQATARAIAFMLRLVLHPTPGCKLEDGMDRGNINNPGWRCGRLRRPAGRVRRSGATGWP